MSNPRLGYRHTLHIPTVIPLSGSNNAPVITATMVWSVDNDALATISQNGELLRNLSADTGTVTATVTGFYRNTAKGVQEDIKQCPFSGSVAFDLIPLTELEPVTNIKMSFS